MKQPIIPENSHQDMYDDSNLVMGLLAGSVAMLISAAIWGAITYFTKYQISWMAIGVGFFVGFTISKFGKGQSIVFAVSGAILSLLGCALGNLFFYSGILATEWSASYFEVLFALLSKPNAIIEIFKLGFEFTDILFYGVAAYVGYKSATANLK